eukprot:scaffold104709_cov13-Tisochrysis_lutea.AAC.1
MGVPGPNFVSERALFLGNATFGPGRSIRPKIWPNQGHVKLFESFKNNVLRVQKEQEAPRRVFVKNGQTIGSASKVPILGRLPGARAISQPFLAHPVAA